MTQEVLFFLLLAFANSLIIIGWNKATYFDADEETLKFIETNMVFSNWKEYIEKKTHERMIFWKLRFWCLRYVGNFWSKPLLTCPTCMASVHSIYFFWLIMPFTLHSLIVYPLYVLGLAGVTSIVNNYV